MEPMEKSFVVGSGQVYDVRKNVVEMKRIEKYKGYKGRNHHQNTRCLHTDK